jgi:hypothetical protein
MREEQIQTHPHAEAIRIILNHVNKTFSPLRATSICAGNKEMKACYEFIIYFSLKIALNFIYAEINRAHHPHSSPPV